MHSQPNFMHVYSEVNPNVFDRTFSQVSVHRITDLNRKTEGGKTTILDMKVTHTQDRAEMKKSCTFQDTQREHSVRFTILKASCSTLSRVDQTQKLEYNLFSPLLAI